MKKTIYTFLFLVLTQFSFSNSILCPDPPANDDPCISSDNPPIDLTNIGFHSGTTCCATPDFDNVACANGTGSSVWYVYTPDLGDKGYTINLEPIGSAAEGPVTVEVYAGTSNQGCSGGFINVLASSCIDTQVSIKIGNCLESEEVFFIKVSTNEADENCGEFMISINPTLNNLSADNCLDLAGQAPIEPVTNPAFNIDYHCVSGSLDFACPENDALEGCSEFTEMPTVWFQVIVDDIAAQLFTTVEPLGNWEPIWSVYSGPDCDNLSIADFGGSPPCSNGDNTPDLHQNSVFDTEKNYWISVTIDPASLPSTGLDNGSFELCVATVINTIICLGDLEGGACGDESLVVEVAEREFENLPLEGPFYQGEEVTINISFFYDAQESGADWLIGFVPIFGAGWDLTNFDYEMNAPIGNGQTGQWYEESGPCAPILQEPNPILCTFINDDGNLELCNQLCSPCSECPQQSMQEGDPLPSGYFWVTNGNNAGCDNDCSPGEGWGIGASTAQIDWTFTLQVKMFDNEDDCYSNKDLSIAFQTFSDGTAGCWEDSVGECLLDRAMFGPAWQVECDSPSEVIGPDQEICHNETTDILVEAIDGSLDSIIVEFEDNPDVTGENNYVFMGGMGIIQDELSNLTDDIQVVIYSASIDDPALPSIGVITEIEVTVYPELKVTFPPVFVCEGECIDMTPDIVGGFDAPYSYQWSTGENTPSINICPVVPNIYFVTVEDALGCVDIAEVQVDIEPPVELLLPENIDVIKDDDFDPFDPDYIVCIELVGGTPPFTVTWSSTPLGLVGVSSGIAGECYAINEESSSDMNENNGQYTLTASVTDVFGCTNEESTIVNVKADSTVFVLDEELLHKISINPNPSNGEFNISSDIDGEVHYIIRDVMGRDVDRGKISTDHKTIYLGSEPNGLYLIIFFTFQIENRTLFIKLLKI